MIQLRPSSSAFRAALIAGCLSVPPALAADAPPMAPLPADLGLRSFVDIAPDYSDRMLDWQWHVTDKAVGPLDALASGELRTGTLYVGGMARGSFMSEHTNIFAKFPLLGQFPTGHKQQRTAGQWFLNNAHIGLTIAPTEWIAGFAELIYTDLVYPGQDQFQVRKAFVSIGNLKQFPVYLSVGKGTIEFGDMRSFNPFVHSMTNHYFNAQTEDAQALIGFKKDGWHITASAIGGGRQQRVADSPHERGTIGNYAINGSKTFEFADRFTLKVGGGYLDNVIYNTATPHHTAAEVAASGVRVHNGAWDVNGMISYRGFDVQAEYTRTLDKWPATNHPVSAMTLQARYTTQFMGWGMIVSAGFSRGEQGPDNTSFHEMKQWVAGIELKPHKQLSIAAEYVHSSDFTPLVRITQTSDSRVRSDTWTFGARLHF